MRFILASASPRRLSLLKQIHVTPDDVIPAEINEDPILGEVPRPHALRLASEKCAVIAAREPDSVVLAADTVVGVGRRILPKAETPEQALECLKRLTGRAHQVYTGIAIYSPNKGLQSRVVETRLKFKTLSPQEIEYYLASEEWHGKAGGYGIQGYAEAFIQKLSGSYSNVVGLPLTETRHYLLEHGVITP
ncbi:septum formation protein [Litorimonas taeanensis]|uniref:dTTP/UTP pyrophosphatase n=1 Tax=Litorimonas taeanensis TaxID=568099 RepID=A0A420WK98_9PROT|nr:nucleoside triphosphate pyrophosphatase [Litorimonas taeanensis]RKQ71342.1 septum formation protein [Litorimonas taeanensis]